MLYTALLALRQLAYRLGLRRSVTLPVPVIVVGNLIVGGAGKTPTVIALVERLQRAGHRPGIVSRGHGRAGDGIVDVQPDTPATEAGDEPLLLRRRTGVPVVVGRDRVAAAQALLAHHAGISVIVADDGLQHRRLGRSAQVIVFDERGTGNGWLLPAGPMRQPLPRTTPASTVVLYNAARATTPLPGSISRRTLRGVMALADWHTADATRALPIDSLHGRPLIAAAGIARPERFFAMLRDQGLVFTPLPLPDHAAFDTLPWPASATDVIVTEKDAVKLDAKRLGSTRVWVAALDFVPDAAFDAAIARLVPAP